MLVQVLRVPLSGSSGASVTCTWKAGINCGAKRRLDGQARGTRAAEGGECSCLDASLQQIKRVPTSQTCFQRGLLKEIFFFKFYKVQPLIMLSHNQSLQNVTVSSLQGTSSIWYDGGVWAFWSIQYGSCHPVTDFFIFKTSVGVTLGHYTTFFFFLCVFQICYC